MKNCIKEDQSIRTNKTIKSSVEQDMGEDGREGGSCFNVIQTHSCSKHNPAVCLLASLPHSVMLLDNLHIPKTITYIDGVQSKRKPGDLNV